MKTILLLGSGELGKEFTIAAKRMGYEVVAVDSYNGAPAMQVTDRWAIINMLDPDELRNLISEIEPDIIVPEIEAIATQVLYEFEEAGMQIVPSARAVNLTMNRDHIRNRAAELGLRTAKFEYAEDYDEYLKAIDIVGIPCVVKPVMSSSGKGQSYIRSENDILSSWQYAMTGMRGDRKKVIVEEFIDFDSEITLLTIKQKTGPTMFCEPIGHYQERGDYQWSWQPHSTTRQAGTVKIRAQEMAKIITDDLGGAGLFGVEFFIKGTEVIFSELSPRPHDTGMVTLLTQNQSEFDLHLKAIMGLPISKYDLEYREGASAVVLSESENGTPEFTGIEDALNVYGTTVRIFGKPSCRKNRRMAVVLNKDLEQAKLAASLIKVTGSE